MGSEMQPRVQKRKIHITRLTKILYLVEKISFSIFYMELEVFFIIIQQTYSETCYNYYELKVFLRIRDTFFIYLIKQNKKKLSFVYKKF
jgi:hypothetical protein